MPNEDEFVAMYVFDEESKQWVASILDTIENIVVTVGVEFSEPEIVAWCEATLESWPLTGKEAPDAFDRMQ